MCSSLGQELIEKDIQELGLSRVVVAACSPHMHEPTFRRACQRAGLNQYLFEMANIREHVSWITDDKLAATEKSKALVSAAVRRVIHHEPLEPMPVQILPATLVVGGGIAGIQAALELAEADYPVYLVERQPSIGGRMAQFDKTFPTLDCAACILTPRMVAVGQNPNVTLLTWSEVEEVKGYIGNFKVRVRKKARYVNEVLCTGCGVCQEKCPRKVIDEEFEAGLGFRKAVYTPFPQAVPRTPVIDPKSCIFFQRGKGCQVCARFCPTGAIDYNQQDEIIELNVGNIILATGYKLFDPRRIPQYGYGRLANVFTSLEFERMTNAAGPTGGRVVLRDGVTTPKTVAIIHCVGSRDRNYNPYCSAICCMSSLKMAHLVHERAGAEVYNFYIDMRPIHKGYEEFYHRLLSEGTHFIRGRVAEVTDAARLPGEEGKLIVQAEDTLIGMQRRIPVDMVILSAGLEPQADAQAVARTFGISCGDTGFFIEKHPKLDPVATMTDGVFVAGTCQGPKDIPDSVAQGAAAAARVLGLIRRGTVLIEPVRASINAEACSGCRICNNLCPYNAIEYHDIDNVSWVNPALCKGCGACVAACPSQAITGAHFSTQQIMDQIEGLLWDVRMTMPVLERVPA
jgi:heterodisulfide reductase subunit A